MGTYSNQSLHNSIQKIFRWALFRMGCLSISWLDLFSCLYIEIVTFTYYNGIILVVVYLPKVQSQCT